MAPSFKHDSHWYNRKATLNSLSQFVNHLAPLTHQKVPDRVTLSHWLC
jgi:hypothetical protein